ncbi:MAG: hypothetical protein PHE74_09105 [Comamonas sp.]|nr:hypothetical protein [Comamonas sp.]
MEDGLLLGLDKEKGRDWLENLAATNPQQPQADFAALDSILYDAVTVRNASKVVDAETGEPLVVYHGTGRDFAEFKKEHQRPGQYGGEGFFFTGNPDAAALFGDAVMPVFLQAKTGLIEKRRARARGDVVHIDHIRPKDDGRDIWVVMEPTQIKSATGNNGNFDPANPDIRFSRSKSQSGLDSEYMRAVEAGDMKTAQRLVNEAAEDAGYVGGADYRMQHEAPSRENDGVSLDKVQENGIVPDDYWTHPEWYASTPEELDAHRSISSALRGIASRKASGKNAGLQTITVYRAIPKNVKDGRIRNGDWVSPSRAYAELEGESIPEGHRIISQVVSAKNLFWDGNSVAEWGYDDGQNYAYRNTKNNRKLLDAVTYDDDNNIIPLSKRFNARNDDIRFSRSAAPSLSEVAETGRDTAWAGPAASKWDDFIYKMQDKHIDTKRALEAVRETGKAVALLHKSISV